MIIHCCQALTEQLSYQCPEHTEPVDCPDHLIVYSRQFDEYGILIHDGGSSYCVIQYCPWCGTRFPESKREAWFHQLEQLGFDDPCVQEIPEAFKTDEWYRTQERHHNR